jgi:hypothetical protein
VQYQRLHPSYRRALERLARSEASAAEAWRALLTVERHVGIARPSYPTVRRFLLDERRYLARRNEKLAELAAEWASGKVPRW